jgi:signal transduction histidine kinase
MSTTMTLGGWLAAVGVATAWRLALARRMALVARACHELRGPLTAARLAVRLAARATSGGPPRGPLAAIETELGRAGLALADLSAARRGGRAGDRMETFELASLLADAAAARRAEAWAKGVRLRLEPPPEGVLLRGDRLRLAQACGNLLANAIEHGGGEVLLRARASRHTVRVEVLDDGPGLPAPVAELVRGARGGRCLRGHGLAHAADVAARYGGRLAAAPSERGARLVLELPTVPVA